MTTYVIEKNPSDEFSLRNRAVVRDRTNDYAKVTVPGNVQEIYLTLASSPKIAAGKVGLSGTQVSGPRKLRWGGGGALAAWDGRNSDKKLFISHVEGMAECTS